MQGLEILAVYEHGTLKLPRELPLAEGQKVTIIIHPPAGAAERLSLVLRWQRSPEDLAALLGPDNHPWAANE